MQGDTPHLPLLCLSLPRLETFSCSFLYCCWSTVVSIFPHHSPLPHPSPPPTLNPAPLWLCPRVLYTCSLMTLPLFPPFFKKIIGRIANGFLQESAFPWSHTVKRFHFRWEPFSFRWSKALGTAPEGSSPEPRMGHQDQSALGPSHKGVLGLSLCVKCWCKHTLAATPGARGPAPAPVPPSSPAAPDRKRFSDGEQLKALLYF